MLVSRTLTAAAVVCVCVLSAACDSAPIVAPSKRDRLSPSKNRVFTVPVVSSLTASRSRAEVDEVVTLTATVSDAESALDALQYTWSATAGTVTGSGAQATWRLPKGAAATPLDVVITLRVTERFTETDFHGNVVEREHTTTATSPSIRVHDSVAELSAMAVDFLVNKFGNSSVPPEACLVNFSDTCAAGKDAELQDIINNRQTFVILSAEATVLSVDINGNRDGAFIVAACAFQDRRLDNGAVGVSSGECLLSAIYEAGRWWLCTSNFAATSGSGAMFDRYRGRAGRPPVKGAGGGSS